MRHLINLVGVGPSDLKLLQCQNITALTDCPVRCRSFRALLMLRGFHPRLYDITFSRLLENLSPYRFLCSIMPFTIYTFIFFVFVYHLVKYPLLA